MNLASDMRAEQAAPSPADVYDQQFVPALFRQWGPVLCDAAQVRRGHRVLDVACGTGALTLALAERVGADGAVRGLDANEQMLAVAARKNARIEWIHGRAETLPFADACFDAVLSQFGLMFFEDRAAGLREMQRVLRPSGHLAVAVCDALARSPGYAALDALLDRLFGPSVAGAFRAPFALGDEQQLLTLCARSGIQNARVLRREGTVRFASIEALVSTERACAWTLGGLLDDDQFEQLLREARRVFAPFVDGGGRVAFAMPALLICAAKSH